MGDAVGVLEAASGDADVGVGVHEVDQRLYSAGPNERVRIEQKHQVRRLRRSEQSAKGGVVSRGETGVVRQTQDFDPIAVRQETETRRRAVV